MPHQQEGEPPWTRLHILDVQLLFVAVGHVDVRVQEEQTQRWSHILGESDAAPYPPSPPGAHQCGASPISATVLSSRSDA